MLVKFYHIHCQSVQKLTRWKPERYKTNNVPWKKPKFMPFIYWDKGSSLAFLAVYYSIGGVVSLALRPQQTWIFWSKKKKIHNTTQLWDYFTQTVPSLVLHNIHIVHRTSIETIVGDSTPEVAPCLVWPQHHGCYNFPEE